MANQQQTPQQGQKGQDNTRGGGQQKPQQGGQGGKGQPKGQEDQNRPPQRK
jgi:hypothetical protein